MTCKIILFKLVQKFPNYLKQLAIIFFFFLLYFPLWLFINANLSLLITYPFVRKHRLQPKPGPQNVLRPLLQQFDNNNASLNIFWELKVLSPRTSWLSEVRSRTETPREFLKMSSRTKKRYTYHIQHIYIYKMACLMQKHCKKIAI